MERFTIKPAKGLQLRDPESRIPLAAEGESKPQTDYWLRRVADGDAIVVDAQQQPKPNSRKN